jgi:hypothetical protein
VTPLELASVVTALLTLSCADLGDRLDARSSPPDAGTDLGELTENAYYFVPVPDTLAEWATYPVRRVRLSRGEDGVRIGYRFPRWLCGIHQPIALEGAPAVDGTTFDVTAGTLGSGWCTQTGESFECFEMLPGIGIDRAQAEVFMGEDGLPEDEIQRRLQVTDVFASDPIGILAFVMP